MRLRRISVLSILAGTLLALPVTAAPGENDFTNSYAPHSRLLASADSDAVKAKRDLKKLGVSPEAVTGNVADMRLASQWMAAAYMIPERVPEALLLAGHSYGDTIVALSLMDYGASLNEVLEKRQSARWPAVAEAVGIAPTELPEVIRAIMVRNYSENTPELLRFFPDVRSGLSERLRLPSCAPTIPDPVSVQQFRLSKREIADVRAVLARPNEATPEMLLKSAGRSLKVADWLIAATLAKYNPNPLETMLMMRTGEVLEWGDIASTFSVDPRIFVSGPLAPVYAVLTGTYTKTVVPSLKRPFYPPTISDNYNIAALEGEQREALRWLMSLYYKENTAERDLLASREYNLRDEALALAISRLALVDLQKVVDEHDNGRSWKSIVDSYHLDLTGEEVFKAACGLNND